MAPASAAAQLSLRDHLSETGVDKWIAEIGCTNAAVPRRDIKAALLFFDTQMPTLAIRDAVSFLAAMDLSRPVAPVLLQPNERLIGFRTETESPFKLFFARRGQSPHALGINTAARGPVHFVVRAPVRALESFTTGTIDTWSPVRAGQTLSLSPRAKKWFGREFGTMAMAGGAQLIVPESYRSLLVEQQ
jgi:hypothetical protein